MNVIELMCVPHTYFMRVYEEAEEPERISKAECLLF